MNLSVSSVNINNRLHKSPSFGMAKFSEGGYQIAQNCKDIYAPLENPTDYQNPDFFKKKPLFRKAPFAKYFRNMVVKNGSEESINQVKESIETCGTTNNAFTNSRFIKQLATVQKPFSKLTDETKTTLSESIEKVLKLNWDNPLISKKETKSLIEMSKETLGDGAFLTLLGLIDKSGIKAGK